MSEQAVHDWIRKQIAANDVVVFMKGTKQMPQCGFSGQVAQILQYLGVDYKDVNVLEDMGIREGIKSFTQWPTIPQLYVKGEFVGGSDIVREMFNAGELQTLLADKGVPDRPQCGFSALVVQILDHLGVDFVGVNVLQDDGLRQGIKSFSDWPTIPQLYVKGEFIGGSDIVREMFQSGELKPFFKEQGLLAA